MYIEFIKDTVGIYNVPFNKGTIKKYFPWDYEWQEMSESERVAKGIFVECHGHGEFDVFRSDVVRPVATKKESNSSICPGV